MVQRVESQAVSEDDCWNTGPEQGWISGEQVPETEAVFKGQKVRYGM